MGEATLPDPDRVQGLLELCQPENGGDLQHFVHARNGLWPAVPELTGLEAPLRGVLEECLQGMERTRRAADRRRLTKGDRTDERGMASESFRARTPEAI